MRASTSSVSPGLPELAASSVSLAATVDTGSVGVSALALNTGAPAGCSRDSVARLHLEFSAIRPYPAYRGISIIPVQVWCVREGVAVKSTKLLVTPAPEAPAKRPVPPTNSQGSKNSNA